MQTKALPENICLEVTTYCDGKCNYCFALPGKENQEMSIEIAKDIIDEAYDLNYRSLHLTGGEPFLWKSLEEQLHYARKKKYSKVFINTGGRFLNTKVKRILREFSDILSFSVTLNGPEEIHHKTRPDKKYQTTLEFIEYIRKRNIPFQIFTVITKPLLADLSYFATDIYQKFPEMKFHTWIQLHRAPGDIEDLSEFILTPSELIKSVHIAGVLRVMGLPIRFLENPLTSVIANRLGFSLPALSFFREKKVSILVDGSVTGAHSSRKSYKKYHKGVLKEILHSQAYSKALEESKVCIKCEFLPLCRKAGMIQPSDRNRD